MISVFSAFKNHIQALISKSNNVKLWDWKKWQ